MQMLGQAGCGEFYCLGAMRKLENEFISSVSTVDKDSAEKSIELCGARGITPYVYGPICMWTYMHADLYAHGPICTR